MLNGIRIGEAYYSIRILPDKADPHKYINEGSELEKLVEQSGNYFKSLNEAQKICDQINLIIKNTKGK